MNVKTKKAAYINVLTRIPNQAVPSEIWTWFPQELGQGFIPTIEPRGFKPPMCLYSY